MDKKKPVKFCWHWFRRNCSFAVQKKRGFSTYCLGRKLCNSFAAVHACYSSELQGKRVCVWASKSRAGQQEKTEKTSPICLILDPKLPSVPRFERYLGKLSKTSKTHNFSTIRMVVLPIHQNVFSLAGTSKRDTLRNSRTFLYPLVFSALVLCLFIQ